MRRVVADAWFRVRKLDDDVTWIDEPFVKEFYRCNLWHVRGRERDLLVDSGWGVVSLRQHIPLVTEKPLIAVASHTHFDHIGGHHEFAERWVHAAEATPLAQPSRGNTLVEPYVTYDVFDALPPVPHSSATYCPNAAPATRLLADGDVVDLGDRVLSVIHTPGHSPGGIALFERSTGTLFSGDIVYDGPLVEDCPGADPDAYERSMRRLLDLPVRVMHGGHFPSCPGERLRELIRDWLGRRPGQGRNADYSSALVRCSG
jgi:glyoxylase-like metal-dependent hydrolase (beta-lactamase superfamily II)